MLTLGFGTRKYVASASAEMLDIQHRSGVRCVVTIQQYPKSCHTTVFT